MQEFHEALVLLKISPNQGVKSIHARDPDCARQARLGASIGSRTGERLPKKPHQSKCPKKYPRRLNADTFVRQPD